MASHHHAIGLFLFWALLAKANCVELACDGSGKAHLLTNAEGEIVSPDYATGAYPDGAECSWFIYSEEGYVSSSLDVVCLIRYIYACLIHNVIAEYPSKVQPF